MPPDDVTTDKSLLAHSTRGACHLSTWPSSVSPSVSQLSNLAVLMELLGLAWAVVKDLLGEAITISWRPPDLADPCAGGLRQMAAAE